MVTIKLADLAAAAHVFQEQTMLTVSHTQGEGGAGRRPTAVSAGCDGGGKLEGCFEDYGDGLESLEDRVLEAEP
jgi:hypothetical protein